MRKRTRRKIYALVNPIAMAIEGCAITQGETLESLRMRELSAIDAFAIGRAGLQEWSDLNSMLSVAETMAREGIGIEVLAVCATAELHLIDAARRFEATRRMGFTVPGLEGMRELFRYHDLQRISVARSVYEQAIKKATNRVRSKGPTIIEL